MRYIEYYNDPDLAEAKIQTLREAMDDGLDWLDNSYPLVMLGVIEDETIPLLYTGDGDNYDLRPNDSVDSYCFFEFYGYATGDENDLGLYNFGVVFWVDLENLDTTKSEDYTWNLISSVLKVMDANKCSNMQVTTDDIFDRYDFDLDKQQLMRRYSGFKITFDMYGVNTFCTYS